MRSERQYIDRIPELEVIDNTGSSSLYMGYYDQPYFERNWHQHPEFELLLITSGHGRRFVGDHVEEFSEGDLVFLGPRLPHAWISDEVYLKSGSEKRCRSLYVQFRGALFESGLSDIGEFSGIRNLLLRSRRGLKVTGRLKNLIALIMQEMAGSDPVGRMLDLIRMLDLVSQSQFRYLASEQYEKENVYFKSRRMNTIHRYVVENFMHEITLEDAAGIVSMTKTSFCRFFKSQSKETFKRYLNRYRIDFAKKLLQSTEMQIKEIGYECGFSSISYFNQTFKRVAGISPRQFRLSLTAGTT